MRGSVYRGQGARRTMGGVPIREGNTFRAAPLMLRSEAPKSAWEDALLQQVVS